MAIFATSPKPFLLKIRVQHCILLISALLTSINVVKAHAALPTEIQGALERAQLDENDISIVVMPIGNKNMSRLPDAVTVISTDTDTDTKAIADIDVVVSAPLSQDIQSPTVNQEALAQRLRKLDAYTDDPNLYLSLESPPPVLTIDETTSITKSNITESNTSESNNDNLPNDDSATITIESVNRALTPLISHNPTSARTPASTMKLIPSFIALDTLGADFVWFTRVYHTGVIIGNRLQGDLIIQASGDPKMTHERLGQLLYHIQKAGIRHIDGDIIIDSSIFQNVAIDPAAFDGAPLRPYNAGPDGFLVNFNSLAVKTYPVNNEQAALTYEPQLANYRLPRIVGTRPARCSQASQSLAPVWQSDGLTFDSLLPQSCGEHIFYINYPDPKDFGARVLASKWQTLGNTLSGTVIAQERPYQHNKTSSANILSSTVSLAPLLSYPSLSLAQQIYDINHFSNNVMTEQLTLSIGSYAQIHDFTANTAYERDDKIQNHSNRYSLYQINKPKMTDYSQALKNIQQWWQDNLKSTPPYLTNGSGLCRDCTVSAANLDELLGFAYQHKDFDTYVNSLGVAGVSGTIAYHSKRLPDSAAIGRAWIKTGTLNNVSAMAGYVKGRSGQDYTVVGIINTDQAINADDARPVLDTLLDWTARQ